jgi:hypothetical protein
MDKESFKNLFLDCVNEAIRRAQMTTGIQPDTFDIELHGGILKGRYE